MAVNGRVALTLLRNRLKKVRGNLSFWVFVVMLTGVTFFHYCTPQVRSLASYSLTRHATERILFILVIVNATSIFGHVGGLVTLALVVLLMLPRVFLISPYPVDAFVEVIAVAFTGYLVVWMLGGKQRAVSRLKTINAVTSSRSNIHQWFIAEPAACQFLQVVKIDRAVVVKVTRNVIIVQSCVSINESPAVLFIPSVRA